MSLTTSKTPHGPTLSLCLLSHSMKPWCPHTRPNTQLSCNLPSALRVNQHAFRPCNPASRTSNSRSRITLDLFRVAPAACHSSPVFPALSVSLVLRALHGFCLSCFLILHTWQAKMPGQQGVLNVLLSRFFFSFFLLPVSACQLSHSPSELCLHVMACCLLLGFTLSGFSPLSLQAQVLC